MKVKYKFHMSIVDLCANLSSSGPSFFAKMFQM
jgi:hypothetical protein